ncbi:N-acetyl-alpha-D-glucosaminyl L-malate synthase [wastewater metagenome]|uniref:N-acetyl-alpha-D-glucosaminyl L-malate synthase n=2 Tax=unclassified sequences TaxID=12908 RepID=A0A5B8RI50_9ZZZZ|nr:glycosyltransferase [Arhodomonas sp. KWT]QEA07598.1 N-acetyl-alpha-D-glucosaminyl L-malate synthase [uncultured organism]
MTANATIGVLHTIDTTGPGGAETVFREVARRLDPARFRSVVAIPGEGWLAQDLRAHGLHPEWLRDARRGWSLRYLTDLVRLVRRQRIDVIHAHLFGASVYASVAGLLTRRPVVATFHGDVDIDPEDRAIGAKFALIRAAVPYTVCVSERLRSSLTAPGRIPAGRCMRIPNGVDVDRYAAATTLKRQRGHSADGTVVIGALGNIRPAKDYGGLLRAIAILAARTDGPRFRLVIAGQPDRAGLYESLLAERAALGLDDRVSFIGHCADVPEFLAGLDLFVMGSVSEGLPVAVLEAMASGVPVVATRCGGPEEALRDRESGVLVPPRDPAALAGAIVWLADEPERARALAGQALADVHARFSMEAMVGAYEGLYEQLAARAGRDDAPARMRWTP